MVEFVSVYRQYVVAFVLKLLFYLCKAVNGIVFTAFFLFLLKPLKLLACKILIFFFLFFMVISSLIQPFYIFHDPVSIPASGFFQFFFHLLHAQSGILSFFF